MQSKKMSMAEVVTNLTFGYIVSVLLMHTLLPMYGHYPDFSTSNQLVLWFTAVSLVRSYSIRRLFNYIQVLLNKRNIITESIQDDFSLSEIINLTDSKDSCLITISLESNSNLSYFFMDRIYELFGHNYIIKNSSEKEVQFLIETESYYRREKLEKYKNLVKVIEDGNYKSYEEIITKFFKLK